MARLVIFLNVVSGHYMEYLNHFNEYLVSKLKPGSNVVFLVPESFHKNAGLLKWSESAQVEFEFYPDKLGRFSRLFLLRKTILRSNAKQVFLPDLMSNVPWVGFFVPRGVHVFGILYLIHVYRWKTSGFKQRLVDGLKYFIFAKGSVYDSIFLLNDDLAPRFLNRRFGVGKFKSLPDPYVGCHITHATDEGHNSKSLNQSRRMILHFGALDHRKGTLDLLHAIIAMKPSVRANLSFVFAGKVNDKMKDEFYCLVDKAKAVADVVLHDRFLGYDELAALCSQCSFVAIPYHNVYQSSGVLAYAAAFGKPVLSPSSGLLGRLVTRYRLGYTFGPEAQVDLVGLLNNASLMRDRVDGSVYLSESDVGIFCHQLFKERGLV